MIAGANGINTKTFNKDVAVTGRVPNGGHNYNRGHVKAATMNYEENWHPTEKDIFFGDDLEKDAAAVVAAPMPVQSPGFKGGLMTGLGLAASGMIAAAVGTGVQRMIQRSEDRRNMLKYEESLRTAMQMSPTLQRHSFNELRGFLPMIAKASPTVASEPRLLANYLETMIDAEGNLNLATFGEIASLENNLLKNQANRNELSNAVILEGVKGVSKGGTEGLIRYIGRR